jgi:glycosyltransferase involved in cell wall biosynthesis
MAEGLPNTLCESMLCECIPVGSSANGIPKAINDERLIVRRHMDVADAAAKIRYALSLPDADGRHFRERIIELFPASRREQDLVSVINTGHV